MIAHYDAEDDVDAVVGDGIDVAGGGCCVNGCDGDGWYHDVHLDY